MLWSSLGHLGSNSERIGFTHPVGSSEEPGSVRIHQPEHEAPQ